LTTEIKAQNRELKLVFETLDQTLLPAYREWPGLVYNTQEELKTHVFNANDEIARDTETTITQEISPLWDNLGTDLSRSFGDAFEDILTEGTDFKDAMTLLVGGLKDAVIGFFGDMVTGFLKNNVFDFVSKEATKAVDTVKDTIGGLAKGATGAATGAISGLWTAGGAALGSLVGTLIGGGGMSKASEQHIQQIVDATRGTRDALMIDYKVEIHAVQGILRDIIFEVGYPICEKLDAVNRQLRTIKNNLAGSVSAQGGFHGTLARDTTIRAHAGERVDIRPQFSITANPQPIHTSVYLDSRKIGEQLTWNSKYGPFKIHSRGVKQRF